jgi:hypothetical protein
MTAGQFVALRSKKEHEEVRLVHTSSHEALRGLVSQVRRIGQAGAEVVLRPLQLRAQHP